MLDYGEIKQLRGLQFFAKIFQRIAVFFQDLHLTQNFHFARELIREFSRVEFIFLKTEME